MMARREMKSLFKGIFMLLISGSHAAFYMMCDYGLYWLLDMLRRFFTKKIAAPGQYWYVMYSFKYFLNAKLFLNAKGFVDNNNLFYLQSIRIMQCTFSSASFESPCSRKRGNIKHVPSFDDVIWSIGGKRWLQTWRNKMYSDPECSQHCHI